MNFSETEYQVMRLALIDASILQEERAKGTSSEDVKNDATTRILLYKTLYLKLMKKEGIPG